MSAETNAEIEAAVRERYPRAVLVAGYRRDGRPAWRVADPAPRYGARRFLCKWCRCPARAWRAARASVWDRYWDRFN